MYTQYEATTVWTTHQPMPQPATVSSENDRRGAWEVRQNWQAMAIAEYGRTQDERRALMRRHFAERLLDLTGFAVAEWVIAENVTTQSATAVVDGIVFRWRGDALVVVRPCAYCGIGCFESPPVASRSDLGYAISLWEPLHADCTLVDPADDVSW